MITAICMPEQRASAFATLRRTQSEERERRANSGFAMKYPTSIIAVHYCMEHFDINIEHGGSTRTFHLTFDKYGWSYRFILNINGTEVYFEPDEERNLRAIVPLAMQDDPKLKEWVALVGQELQVLLNDK